LKLPAAFVIGAVWLLATASAVPATTVSLQGGTMVVQAAPGETNQVILTNDAKYSPNYVATQHGTPIQAGPGCTGWPNVPQVQCPIAAVTSIAVDLADGNDTVSIWQGFDGTGGQTRPWYGVAVPVTVEGGDGRDYLSAAGGTQPADNPAGPVTLRGGPGDDSLHAQYFGPSLLEGGDGNDNFLAGTAAAEMRGGPGNDTFNGGRGADIADGGDGADTFWTKGDGQADQISCGPGKDPLVNADPIDRVSSDCEDRIETKLSAEPCSTRLLYSRKGVVRLCVRALTERFSGTVMLWTHPSRSSGKKAFELARARVTARPGERMQVVLRISRKKRRKIARRADLRVGALAEVVDEQGNTTRHICSGLRLVRPKSLAKKKKKARSSAAVECGVVGPPPPGFSR
jgi:hypothetical protein